LAAEDKRGGAPLGNAAIKAGHLEENNDLEAWGQNRPKPPLGKEIDSL
jgi:hypothetical protein